VGSSHQLGFAVSSFFSFLPLYFDMKLLNMDSNCESSPLHPSESNFVPYLKKALSGFLSFWAFSATFALGIRKDDISGFGHAPSFRVVLSPFSGAASVVS
jgi:hypothetical protein